MSLDVTDDAFANTWASGILTATAAGATTTCFVLGGPPVWTALGVGAGTLAAINTGRQIPEWWRTRTCTYSVDYSVSRLT